MKGVEGNVDWNENPKKMKENTTIIRASLPAEIDSFSLKQEKHHIFISPEKFFTKQDQRNAERSLHSSALESMSLFQRGKKSKLNKTCNEKISCSQNKRWKKDGIW